MRQLNDIDLIHQAITGNAEAFGELFKRHVCGVRIEASQILFSKDDEEDAAQETFLRAFQKISTLRPPYSFGCWVRQIARNIARNMNSRSPHFVQLDNDSLSTPDYQVSTESSSEREFNAVQALSRLSPKLREAARLSYLSNRSNKDIARRLGIPLGTVKSRLSDSRAKMQKGVIAMQDTRVDVPFPATAPEIKIREIKADSMTIDSRGPGLYFGSVLEVGHVEKCRFYDYPGGILTQTVKTQVIREVDVLGRNCLEVLIEHSDCEPTEPNVLDYFEVCNHGFSWVMRTVANDAYPQNRFMKEGSELFPKNFSAGDHGEYAARAVELSIGSVEYGRCLAVFWAWEGGTPAESFYTRDGRQVLHRRYRGPDSKAPGAAEYSELENEYVREFMDIEYRIWYDTVLSPT